MPGNIPLEHKAKVMKAMWLPMMDALAGGAPDNEVSGDDLVELFAFGLAMVIENDSHLTNPRQVRLAIETVKTHVARNVKTLQAVKEKTGRSYMSMVMEPADGVAVANDNLFGSVSND